MCFNYQNIVNGQIIGSSCQNNYDELQKQLGFYPCKDPFTIFDEKRAILFYFSIQTCNSYKL
jgi:hypothetical protein